MSNYRFFYFIKKLIQQLIFGKRTTKRTFLERLLKASAVAALNRQALMRGGLVVKNQFVNRVRYAIILGCAATAAGCTRDYAFKESYIKTYQNGHLATAEDTASRAFSASLSQNNYKADKDSVWKLLDRATIRFAQGKSKKAIADYQLALEAIDYYNQYSANDTAEQLILQDDKAAYAGPYYEQILARIYFALALMDQGDSSNAYALLRQAEFFHQKLDGYSAATEPLAKYLLALFSEQSNDLSNAELLYKQVESLMSNPLDLPKINSDSATLVILCHNGNVPTKISSTCAASVVSTASLEKILLATNHKIDPAWSSYTGIPIPALHQPIFSTPVRMYASVNQQTKYLSPLLNIATLAQNEVKQQAPLIAARGVARMIIRRATVGCAQEQNRDLGTLVDFGMLLANLNTKADTRSWSTLPASIDLARFSLPPGRHCVSIATTENFLSGQMLEIELNANDLCIVNIFALHPGITTIVVPKKFYILNPVNKEYGL